MGTKVNITGEPMERIRATDPTLPRVDATEFAAALGAEAIGDLAAAPLDPIMLAALGNDLQSRLWPSGGARDVVDTSHRCAMDTGQRTIIDILRKGNQELFHSSMVAWLLDPTAEHSYGRGFLDRFAALVAQRGDARLAKALLAAPLSGVTTEATDYKRRYDIVLRLGQLTVRIENKTKTLGTKPQFDQYQDDGGILVALGLTDVSFDRQVRTQFPVLTYSDVLALLDSLGEPSRTDYGVLIAHYCAFLRRELGLLAEVQRWGRTGSAEATRSILQMVGDFTGLTLNDRRFLNLYFLEQFLESLSEKQKWKGCRWETNKNMQSDVWLALNNPGEPPSVFGLNDTMKTFCTRYAAGIWFHIELWNGVLCSPDDEIAGAIQLRCWSNTPCAQVIEGFRSIWNLADAEQFARPKANAGTFQLVRRPLKKCDLPYERLEKTLDSFMGRFGAFP